MSPVLRVVLFVSDPLRKLSAHLTETLKVVIELDGDHALILSVVVAEDEAPVRERRCVDGPAVVEVEAHSEEQFGDGVDDSFDRQALSAAAKRTIAALDQRRAFQPGHDPFTSPALSP